MQQKLKLDLETFSLRDAPGHLIRLCQQRAVDLFTEEVGTKGPTPRQFAVLITVLQKPGLSQTELVKASGIDRSTLTEVLRRMIDHGMISKSRTRQDQRANAIYLTSKGEHVVENHYLAVTRAQERIMASIEDVGCKTPLQVLRALAGYDYDNLQDHSVET